MACVCVFDGRHGTTFEEGVADLYGEIEESLFQGGGSELSRVSTNELIRGIERTLPDVDDIWLVTFPVLILEDLSAPLFGGDRSRDGRAFDMVCDIYLATAEAMANGAQLSVSERNWLESTRAEWAVQRRTLATCERSKIGELVRGARSARTAKMTALGDRLIVTEPQLRGRRA